MAEIINSSEGFLNYVVSSYQDKEEELNYEGIEKELKSSGILRKIISKPVTDALKNEFNDNYKLKNELIRVVEHIRKYGKALIIYDDSKTLSLAPSKNFKKFIIVTKWDIDKGDIVISIEENGEEKEITPHGSRCIIFDLQSEVQALYRYTRMLEKSISVPVDMLGKDQLNYFKINGLADALSGCGDNCQETYNKLWNKIQTLYQLMENTSIAPIDGEEEFGQIKKPVSDYKNLQEFLMTMVSTVSEIPITVLFGVSPAGFNAGGHELENYYNYVHSEVQVKIIEPILEIIKGPLGIDHDGFNPIKSRGIEEEEKEADIIKKRADAISAIFDMMETSPTDKQIIDFVFKGKDIEDIQDN